MHIQETQTERLVILTIAEIILLAQVLYDSCQEGPLPSAEHERAFAMYKKFKAVIDDHLSTLRNQSVLRIFLDR